MKPAKDIWETAKGSLQVQVNKANYETWLKDTTGVSYQSNRFVVGTPKAFAKEYLEKRLHSLVKKTLIGIIGSEIELCFEVCASPGQYPGYEPGPRSRSDSVQSTLPLHKLNPRYTFADFVVADSNRLAFAAALGVAEEPGCQYNPLFIYGGAGLGKSHLVHALGNDAFANGLRVAYASGEQFTTDFVNAVKERTSDQFRHKFRGIDLLIIEDIQFVIGKRQTQLSLFHIFDELHSENRQVVITGSHSPQSMGSMHSELCSSLECGLIAKVRPPSLQTRMAILRAKAERHKVAIDDKVFEFIALQCQANVRKLEGLLTRVIAYSKMGRKRLSLEVATEALNIIAQESSPTPPLTPVSIMTAVSNHFNVSLEHMRSKKRDAHLTLARQMAIYLVREKTSYPLHSIGQLFGGRDHSTILRSYHRMSQEVTADAAAQRSITQILKGLGQ